MIKIQDRRKNISTSVPPLKSKELHKHSTHLPLLDCRPATPDKKLPDERNKHLKNFYSPNTTDKSPQKDHNINSKAQIFRRKNAQYDNKDDYSVRTFESISFIEKKFKKPSTIIFDREIFACPDNVDDLALKKLGKESLSKIREDILKTLAVLINSSNAVTIVPAQSPNYMYYIGKGNNSELIKRIFMTRPWWSQADEEAFPNVNLAWTPLLNQKFVQTIPTADGYQKNCSSVDLTNERSALDQYQLGYSLITKSPSYIMLVNKKVFASASIRLHNRLEFNFNLTDKKHLYINMKKYYQAIGLNVFDHIPLTFHVENEDDPMFSEFIRTFEGFRARKSLNLWILKPGENCNRGNGICVCNSIEKIRNELRSNPFPKTGEHTFVIQKYIEKPFLINKRKFDIRLYCLVTSINGIIQAYYYQDGYIRTSCKEYNAKNLDNKFIHLTNDAIQKKSEDYGKYEFANKMSYADFQRYLESHRPKIYANFIKSVVPRMKSMVKDSICATFKKIDLKKRAHSFEIYGYDFLLDEQLRPWLIEVNTNPCLELSSGLLASIIPAMLENAFRIAIDPLFPPPASRRTDPAYCFNENFLQNKFELLFHELTDGSAFLETLSQRKSLTDFLM